MARVVAAIKTMLWLQALLATNLPLLSCPNLSTTKLTKTAEARAASEQCRLKSRRATEAATTPTAKAMCVECFIATHRITCGSYASFWHAMNSFMAA